MYGPLCSTYDEVCSNPPSTDVDSNKGTKVVKTPPPEPSTSRASAASSGTSAKGKK